MRACLFHIIISLLGSSVCLAQQQYTFTKYSEPHGLTTSSMWQMFKDTTGYLWIYSELGIARFDGYNSKLFRHNSNDANSILDNPVEEAFLLPDGNIYLETLEEARLYDPQKLAFNKSFACKLGTGYISYSYRLKKDNNAFFFFTEEKLVRVSNAECDYFQLPEDWHFRNTTAASDSLSNIMLNVSGRVYVFKSNVKRFAQINLYDRFGKLDTSVFSVAYSSVAHNFIAISKKHLYRYDKNTDEFLPGLDLHQAGTVQQRYEDDILLHQNNYFAFTRDGKLYKLNIKTGVEKIVQLNKKIPEIEIDGLKMGLIDKNGILWIYSSYMGFFRYDILSDQFEQFVHEPGQEGSIPTNNIITIVPDDEGMAWIGCGVKGLVKMEPVMKVMEHLSPGENKKKIVYNNDVINVRSFLETESGYLVGAIQGFFRYDVAKKEFFLETTPYSHYKSSVSAMTRDKSANFWCGTWQGLIGVVNSKSKKEIKFKIQIGATEVRTLFCDSKNTMWIGTGAGKIYTVKVNEIDFQNPA